jgi:hypothetical protein
MRQGLPSAHSGQRVWPSMLITAIVLYMYPNSAPDQTTHSAGGSTIVSLLRAMRERRWDHDRRRRIAKMLKREQASLDARTEWLEGMAIQLAQIRRLPEVAEPRR